MKILQIAPAWIDTPPKEYGGTEWVISNLTSGLVSLGHDVTLFATGDSQSSGKLQYIFKKSLLKQGFDWKDALPVLMHYFEAFKNAKYFDIVHAHLSSTTDLMLLPLLSELTERGIPNLLTIHSRWPYDSTIEKIFLKFYAKNILAVNISQAMHKTLPKQFRDGGVVFNSIDFNKFMFYPKGKNYFTWLGKILPEKGIAEAIKIAKKARKQFIFAGVIDTHVERSMKYFKQQVKPLIDNKQIHFVGPANLKLKNQLLGGAKAFLNPIAWEEPFGMVVLESMASGTPVISYNRGAIPELIEDGKTGFLVKNEAEMVKAINQINKIDRQACRQHVENNFSTQKIAQQYLKVYLSEIKSHKMLRKRKVLRVGQGANTFRFRNTVPVALVLDIQ